MMSDMKKNWFDLEKIDLERKFGRVLGEFRRRFPEHRWLLWTFAGSVALYARPLGGMVWRTAPLGIAWKSSSPERFLERVLEDIGPRLLGTKAGFSSLEELDLFLGSVGKERDFA